MMGRKQKRLKRVVYIDLLAEAVRFELTNGCPLPVFKTGAIDHSATLPYRVCLSKMDSNQLCRQENLRSQWFVRQKQSLQITQHIKATLSRVRFLQITLYQSQGLRFVQSKGNGTQG